MNNPIQYLKGVGPSRAEGLIESGIKSSLDALFYFPTAYIDREAMLSIEAAYRNIYRRQFFTSVDPYKDADFKHEITIVGEVVGKEMHRGKRAFQSLSLKIKDETGTAKINFWSMVNIFDKLYEKGITIAVFGKASIDKYNNLAFDHPEIEIIQADDAEKFALGGIIPKYRLTDKMKKVRIGQKVLRTIIEHALAEHLPHLEETLPGAVIKHYHFPKILDTIKTLHSPQSREDLDKARKRIKFEELFYYFIRLAIRKKNYQRPGTGIVIQPKSSSARLLYDNLPFRLTADQKTVLNEIAKDFTSGVPMHRLLQGDVGSGKTIVALLAMLMVIDKGYQAVLIAPTEILAEQHYKTISKLLEMVDLHEIKITCITGGALTKSKKGHLSSISCGDSNIVIGTHALFQNSVSYNKLAFIVIDEQQRFGVVQKAKLVELAEASFHGELRDIKPHILVTTATPIPRSIMMTVSGDLDVSVIKTKPRNRKPIITKIKFDSQRDEVYSFIRTSVKDGRQVYLVYALVDESEKIESKAATTMHEHLATDIFPDLRCGLLHGQMSGDEKDKVMSSFLNKEFDILISTTVIEVGIDVPNANLIIIENAERFGLSQLHQLRGRVGRDEYQSYCVLLVDDKYQHLVNKTPKDSFDNQAALVRLKAMEDTNDGFKISEIDLKLRGPGDIIGTRQSGSMDFKYADIVEDIEVLTEARDIANQIISLDPELLSPNHYVIKKYITEHFGDNMTYDVA
ncbi:MAG: ATP-dependent DNA helicase RecG [bacterium]